MSRRGHPAVSRYAAPVAFLLGVTIAVLLVRSGLGGGHSPAGTTLGPVTRTTTAHVTTGTSTGSGRARYTTVQRGDTFGSIAARAGTSVADLERLNPGVSSNSLQVGQRVRVG